MFPSQLEFLRHMLDECEYILHATEHKTQEDIMTDETLSRAVVRSLEIIGEASKRVTDDFKIKYVQIDWKEMAGMRDKLIHQYFGIDYDVVYRTIQKDIPQLHPELMRIIALEGK